MQVSIKIVKIWHNQQQPVTGFYRVANNQLNKQIQDAVVNMAIGQTKIVHVKNLVSGQSESLNVQLIEREESEGDKLGEVNERSEAAKLQGNAFIKDKKYAEAIRSYKKAYQLIEYSCDSSASETRLSVMSNLALATLNSGLFKECLEWCNKHIQQSVEINKKVMYRKVCGYKGLKEWVQARKNIDEALRIWANDESVKADFGGLRDEIEKLRFAEIAAQKKVYSNMFG